MKRKLTIQSLLQAAAERSPAATAIAAPGRAPLSYRDLSRHLDVTALQLSALGLGRTDRVALILPDGPETAVASLAIASSAICAPLNPAYRADELDRYLQQLGAQAVLLPASEASQARAVAQTRGLQLLELSPLRDAAAGLFTLAGQARHPASETCPRPDDVAFILPTSGTTARPKLVPLTHQQLCTSASSIADGLQLQPSDRCLSVLPLHHVHGLIGALLSSLAAGASVVCPADFAAQEFFALLQACQPTWYTAVPTLHQAILAWAERHHESGTRGSLRLIRSCSAPLPPRVLAELEATFQVPVIEAYGMTEAAHQIASNPLPPDERKPGSVGRPTGPDVAIMSERGDLLPPNEVGEIVIRGASVMRGYDDPPPNESAFRAGWFRTGDRGYLDTGGYLFITGRLREMINRGGEKIAPAEVDRVLLEHPAVAQAATFAQPHPQLGEEGVAAITLRPETSCSEREIREFVAARLADFKVPRRILVVEQIPLGPTGKLQRDRLADQLGLASPKQPPAERRRPYRPPRTTIERALAELWTGVLDREPVGLDDDFFALGGDSILAVRLLARLRDELQVELSLLSIFEEASTPGGMAQLVVRLAGTSPHEPTAPPPKRQRAEAGPLSFIQEAFWFVQQLEPDGSAYNRPAAIRLRGPLELPVLQRSLAEIVRRHEILRTTFPVVDGAPLQVVGNAEPVALPLIDLAGLEPTAQQAEVRRLVALQAGEPFDLARGPLLRLTLLRLGSQEHLLALTAHHITFDGQSMEVFLRELAALYLAYTQDRPSPLPELPIQTVDFAAWQRERLTGATLTHLLDHWQARLQGQLPILELPTDHPRPPIQSFEGARHRLVLPESVSAELRQFGQTESATLFMVLLAAFQALLHRYSGQDDLIVGAPMADRDRLETESLIGPLFNMLPLRTSVAGDPSFRELLRRVRTTCLEAFEHRALPFDRLVRALQPERDLSRTPIFQVTFSLKHCLPPLESASNLTLSLAEIEPGTARFDLNLELWDRPDALGGHFEYRTDLFEPETIARLAGHFQTLLEGIVANPDARLSDLPLLTEPERHQLLVEWNATAAEYPRQQCVHQLIEAQAARTPEATALVSGGQRLTYAELNHRANQLAHSLQQRGVGPETIVGLCLERSPELVVGLLGIWKAGGAYLPLDPSYPEARLAFMLSDARVPLLVTNQALLERLPLDTTETTLVLLDGDAASLAEQPSSNPTSAVRPDHLAYLIYTSGSTGHPKGVLVEHRGLINLVHNQLQQFGIQPDQQVIQFSSFCWDASVYELLLALTSGASLVLTRNLTDDFGNLAATIEALSRGVTILPPSVLDALSPPEGGQLELVIAGGERCSQALVERWASGRRFFNAYGPTECTIWSSFAECSLTDPERASIARRDPPLGRPIANTQVYLLDRRLQPVPIGQPGELYLGGVGLARGYLNRPALTAERFLPHPFSDEPGARLYRTGDLARYRADGQLEFLGRTDQQVKIRGHRIEPGEIEAALQAHHDVEQVAVVTQEDGPAASRLVAYVVPRGEAMPAVGELRRFLSSRLPGFMLPATFVPLQRLPLTPNGKLDRASLPPPDRGRPALEGACVPPRSPVERVLVEIWFEVLGLEQIGIHDSFFDLGGHSLLATRAISRLNDRFRLMLSVRSILEAPTIAQLANLVETSIHEAIAKLSEEDVLQLVLASGSGFEQPGPGDPARQGSLLPVEHQELES